LATGSEIDNQVFLKSSILPSKMLILLAGTCLGWIGLISLAIVAFAGSGVSIGWIVAGALVMALAVWLVILWSEFRQAVTPPDGFLKDESTDDELVLEDQPTVGYRLGFAAPGTDRVTASDGDCLTGRQRAAHFRNFRSGRSARPKRSGFR
jgi:hypothetical protein